jgi:hypothetical protein
MKKQPWHIGFDSVVDPDFDELGGELTLEQIRHPTLSWAQCWNPKPVYSDGDPLRYAQKLRYLIKGQRDQLNQLFQRLQTAGNFKTQIALKRLRLEAVCELLLAAQRSKWPKFGFRNTKCRGCIPYNGRHTMNYWATGQVDCW